MTIPTFTSYGEYASSNYGAHSLMFSLPNGVNFYYSYQTLVAFRSPFSGQVVMVNMHSTTTGKHLNWIDGGNKRQRVSPEVFEAKLQEMLEHYDLVRVNPPHHLAGVSKREYDCEGCGATGQSFKGRCASCKGENESE